MLLDIGGVDYLEPRAALRRRLPSARSSPGGRATRRRGRHARARARARAASPEDDPACRRSTDLWPSGELGRARDLRSVRRSRFDGHPDLRRIQMPDDWEGHPLRKDYPVARTGARDARRGPRSRSRATSPAGTPPSGQTAAALQRQIAAAREAARARDGRARNAPSDRADAPPTLRRSTMDVVDADRRQRMILSMGPQHPSTHGVLQVDHRDRRRDRQKRRARDRLPAHRHREVGREPVLDAGVDRDRADGLPLAALQRALLHLGRRAAARASPTQIPQRAQQVRVLLCRTARASRRTACGWAPAASTSARSRRSSTPSTCARASSISPNSRAARACIRTTCASAACATIFPQGFLDKLDALIAMYPQRMRELRKLLQDEPDLAGPHDRRRHPRPPKKRSRGASPGPRCARSGVAYDVRKAFPYCGYEQYEFDVPTRTEGDAYARFLVRLDEMDQSMRIIRQVRKQLDTPGPVMIDDTKIAPPPKETIALSMEALIHHFKIVSEGVPRAAGRRLSGDRGPARRARHTTSSPTATTGRGACARVRRRCTTCKCSRRWRSAN